MIDCPICASGNIEHRDTHPLTMTNDEAQDWLLAQHNAAPGPPDPARFGAAIRAIRAKAIRDTKELLDVEPALRQSLDALSLRVTTSRGGYVGGGRPHATVPDDPHAVADLAKSIEARMTRSPSAALRADQPPSKGEAE